MKALKLEDWEAEPSEAHMLSLIDVAPSRALDLLQLIQAFYLHELQICYMDGIWILLYAD